MTKSHAIRSASGMYRWGACPGSINLIEHLVGQGLVDPTRMSPYAIEGSAAHELAERCLRTNAQPDTFVGQWMTTETVPTQVTTDMAEAVQVYVDYVRSISVEKGDSLAFIEQTFDLGEFYDGLFGTCDCVIYHIPTTTLYVIDYKHGQGVPIEATGNPQLRYYGLGALVRMHELKLPHPSPTRIVLVIVQPRAPHALGPVRSETITSASLLMWADELVAAAKATEPVDAPLVPGDHCRFCLAAPRCPKLYEDSLAAAQMAFSPLDLTPSQPTPARELSDLQLQRALQAAQLIEPWLRDLYAHVQALLESGDDIPGWKLVQKRALRHWAMDTVVTEPELMKLGLTREQIYEMPALRSPAQIEKQLPRSRYDALKPLVVKVSSGVTLAPESDPRPPVRSALPFHPIPEGAS